MIISPKILQKEKENNIRTHKLSLGSGRGEKKWVNERGRLASKWMEMAHCGSAQWWMAGKNENRRNERGTEGGGSLD